MAVTAHHKNADTADFFALAIGLVACAFVLSLAVALLSQPAVQTWIETGAGFVAQKIVGMPAHLSPLR